MGRRCDVFSWACLGLLFLPALAGSHAAVLACALPLALVSGWACGLRRFETGVCLLLLRGLWPLSYAAAFWLGWIDCGALAGCCVAGLAICFCLAANDLYRKREVAR